MRGMVYIGSHEEWETLKEGMIWILQVDFATKFMQLQVSLWWWHNQGWNFSSLLIGCRIPNYPPRTSCQFLLLPLELALRHPPSLFSHLAPVLKLYSIIFYKCNFILDVCCKFVLVSEMYICNFSGVSCSWSIWAAGLRIGWYWGWRQEECVASWHGGGGNAP